MTWRIQVRWDDCRTWAGLRRELGWAVAIGVPGGLALAGLLEVIDAIKGVLPW